MARHDHEEEVQYVVHCPRCHNATVQFRREEVGSTKSKDGRKINYRTQAFCRTCGFSYDATNVKMRPCDHGKRKSGNLKTVLITILVILIIIALAGKK